MRIITGIILYNPDIPRLRENISAVLPQVDKVVLVENGSSDITYLKGFEDEKIELIVNDENMGIAYALNQVMQFAYDNGAEWALTLDQDSVVADNLVEEYKRFMLPNVGIVTCCINDRNFVAYGEGEEKDGEELQYCITSASMTNVKAVIEVGGFDNEMFIDWVDWDICLALRHGGYKIIRASKTYIIHELGEKTKSKVWHGHQLLIMRRSKMRNYYINRNWIYIARKWEEVSLLKNTLICIKRILVAVLLEPNKWQSVKALTRGMIDGFLMPIRIQK